MDGDRSTLAKRTIEAVGFDEDDRDIATSGLCATFALAMKQVFPDLQLALLCLADENGKAQLCRDGSGLMWRHAVAIEGDAILDVDGHVRMEHISENYCWGNLRGRGGVLVFVDDSEMRKAADDDDGFYQDHLDRWVSMLTTARDELIGNNASVPAFS